jgi:hypothetical protein
MPEKEVQSPVSRRGSKVGSGQPLSPGARSNPSRGDAERDPASEPPQDAARRSRSKPAGAQTTIVGPSG